MGKFARKLSRTRCLSGKLRYKTRVQARHAMQQKYELHGVKTSAEFCILCGAFHLVKLAENVEERNK